MNVPRLRARGRLLAAIGTGTLMLAGCASPTPYQPATGHGFNRTGFSEQRIESNRYMVSFSGNSLTSRETVERYLLFRAAELTVQQGFDHFILVYRNTEIGRAHVELQSLMRISYAFFCLKK